MKLLDDETRMELCNPKATLFHIHFLYSSPLPTHLLSWSLLLLFHFISLGSSHIDKTQWKPSVFTEGPSPESKIFLPSLGFSAWFFLLLSLVLSHRFVQVWPVGSSSHS